MKKSWIVKLSVILNILFLIYVTFLLPNKGLTSYLFANQNSSASSFPVKFSPYYLDRRSLFDVLPQSQDDIIFLGDSLVERCEWSELLNNHNIKNRGIGGDKLYSLINRLDQVTKTRPRKLFIMAGINDILANEELNKVVYQYRLMLSNIKQFTPETQVFIQSVLPANKSFRGTVNNDNIVFLNQELEVLAKQFQYEYIDLYSYFSIRNQLLEKYTHDGLHLNGEGYNAWKQIIEKYLD